MPRLQGYMHSGYPVMAHLDVCTGEGGKLPHLVDVKLLRKEGSWGVFHEFGHNRQRPAWTFDGTGEVTVNIFSLYCCYKIMGQLPFDTEWFKGKMKECVDYLDDPTKTFDDVWREAPGIALGTYACFIQRYGFEPISKMFIQYQELEARGKEPKSDADKIDEWVRQSSKAVSKDLRPFYRIWKWPFRSEKVADVCAALPADDCISTIAGLRKGAAGCPLNKVSHQTE